MKNSWLLWPRCTLTQQNFTIVYLLLLCGYGQKWLFICNPNKWAETSNTGGNSSHLVATFFAPDMLCSAVQVEIFNPVTCANPFSFSRCFSCIVTHTHQKHVGGINHLIKITYKLLNFLFILLHFVFFKCKVVLLVTLIIKEYMREVNKWLSRCCPLVLAPATPLTAAVVHLESFDRLSSPKCNFSKHLQQI